MVAPPELLAELAALEGSIGNIRNAVDQVLSEGRSDGSEVRVGEALNVVESAIESWLVRTQSLEARLLHHALEQPGDVEAMVSRLGAMALLHTAVASDLAVLSPLDAFDETALLGPSLDAGLPDSARSADEAAFGEGQLLAAMSTPDDDGEQTGPEAPPYSDYDIDDVVSDLVARAGRCATSVLTSLGGGLASMAFHDVSPYLRVAAQLAPEELRSALHGLVGRVSRMVGAVVSRIDALWSIILGPYRPAVDEVLAELNATSLLVEALAGKAVGRVMKASALRASAAEALAGAPDGALRVRRIRTLKKKHHTWVGPVRILARGIPHLWTVPMGPVPAAPVVALGLIAWTLLVTGDQLDAPGRYPRLWTGVLGYAQGHE